MNPACGWRRDIPRSTCIAVTVCLHRLARNDEALPICRRVTQAAPQLLDAWRGLATAQTALGRAQDALHSRRRTLQAAPGNHEVALEHATALLAAGHVEEAARRLKALLDDAWMTHEHGPGLDVRD